MKLNLGCGRDYREGWVNIDRCAAVRADFHLDLERRQLHFPDNSCSQVLMRHVFEHFANPMKVMTELYRVCEPDAEVEIHCPYWSSFDAWGDPDHKAAISLQSFVFYDRTAYHDTPGNPISPASAAELLPACDFAGGEISFLYWPKWRYRSLSEQEFAREHYVNVVQEIHVKLRCIKPARDPRAL